MTTPTSAVAIAQLAVYIILLPLIVYVLYTHRKPGLLGWIYLFLFCTMQLISAGLQISKPEDTTAAILSSVGLSPFLLGLAGITHEAHTYLSPQNGEKAKLGWAFQLSLHLVTVSAVAIVAVGASNLAKDAGTSKYSTDLELRKVGSILLLVAFLAIAAHASWIFLRHRASPNSMARRLLYSSLPPLPLIFSRLIYTIVYSFAAPSSHTFRALNPATASIAIRVVFILLLPLLAVLSLIVGGLLSRRLARHEEERRPQSIEGYQGGELQDLAQK